MFCLKLSRAFTGWSCWRAGILLMCLVGPSLTAHANQIERSAEELKQLSVRIDSLNDKLAREASERDSLTAELDKIEQRLVDLNRSIRQNAAREVELSNQLGALETESEELAVASSDASARLVKLLQSGYMLGRQSGLRMLINQEDPHKAARRMAMFRYVIEARNDQLAEIATLNVRVNENRIALETATADLAAARTRLRADEAALAGDRAARDAQVNSLKASLREGNSQLAVYQERQGALEQLMTELRRPKPKPKPEPKPAARVAPEKKSEPQPKPAPRLQPGSIAAQAALARARQSASDATEPAPRQASRSTDTQSASVAVDGVAEAEPAGITAPIAKDIAVKVLPGFANNRGQLPKPLEAKIDARFGDRRQDGGQKWQGILFGARNGQAVRAVYPGQVVFSDWFRGYGQLMVVDHGDGYMSLYGHNQQLNVGVGASVSAGQVIAGASDATDVPVAGLYFEIRHNGEPDDPLQWIR